MKILIIILYFSIPLFSNELEFQGYTITTSKEVTVTKFKHSLKLKGGKSPLSSRMEVSILNSSKKIDEDIKSTEKMVLKSLNNLNLSKRQLKDIIIGDFKGKVLILTFSNNGLQIMKNYYLIISDGTTKWEIMLSPKEGDGLKLAEDVFNDIKKIK